MYSYRIEQAIRAAAVLHQGQTRKGSMPFPFVTHLYSVAMMLGDYTTDEDVIVAALLHDTIEDAGYEPTELEEDFGGRVREIVEALSEPLFDGERKLSWNERKRAYAKLLKTGPKESALIAAVDKIHNFRTIVEEYYDNHNRFLQDFGKNLDERIEVYQVIANVINNRLDGAILTEFNHVFDEYKNFIYAIKQAKEVEF